MTKISDNIISRMTAMADPAEAAHLGRFFKTGKGEYGEGDRFLGIRVPITRSIVKEYRRQTDLEDIKPLLVSAWHEVRLAGFLLLIEIYRKSRDKRFIVDFYLSVLDRGNNWDLVDMVAPKILGDWLTSHPEERGLLYELAAMEGWLWHQRVAVVTCWTIIRSHDYDDTLRLCELMLTHPHDLIHKASGWMLREVGKRGGMSEMLGFLDRNAAKMPRTMLRYSIEKLPEESRKHYLSLGR